MRKGFTLIELLVTVTIFVIIVSITSGIFISSIRVQRKVLATQELLNQTSYIMEYMSRFLRMAKKEVSNPPVCLSAHGLNYEITRAGRGLRFINYHGICQEFFWDGTTNRLKENKGGDEQFLTSDGFQIIALNFQLHGQNQNDNLQPRVTLFLNIKGIGENPELQPEIKIQTTISQRDLDIMR